jgi:hypothetical protein
MDSLRLTHVEDIPLLVACCRCEKAERPWDRIAAKAYCPHCQEALVVGEAPPLVERTEKRRCAVCDRVGTVCFHTFPLQEARAVAMDLCPEHLRGLLGRRLSPQSFFQLRRRLQAVGFDVEDIFLLHGAFYDSQGRAIQPAVEMT